MNNFLGELLIRLGLDSSKLDKGLQNSAKGLDNFKTKVTGGLSSLSGAFGSIKGSIFGLQGAMLALGGSAVVGGIMKAVEAYMDAEAQVIRLGSALQSTGRYSEEAMTKIRSHAEEMMKLTAIDDDDIVGATATFAKFAQSLNPQQLAEGQKLIIGLSKSMKIDLNTAAVQAGKAVSGASDTIGRSGIKIKDTKDQAERLSDALHKTSSFFDEAKASADSLQGQQAMLNVVWGNFLETLGETILSSVNVKGAFEAMAQGIMAADGWIKQNQQSIITFIKVLGALFNTVTVTAGGVLLSIGGILTGIVAAITDTALQGINAINKMLQIVTQAINYAISNVNKVPGVKIAQIANIPQIGTGGLQGINNFLKERSSNSMAMAGKLISSLRSDWSDALGPHKIYAPKITGGGGGGGLEDLLGGGDSGSKAKKEKSEAEKQMDKLKDRAKQLQESVKTIWEKEADAIKEADMMLKQHLITQETYNRLVEKAHKEALSGLKIEGVKEAVDKFFKPYEEKLDAIGKEGSDALKEAADDVKNWIKDNTDAASQYFDDTRTKAEQYAIDLKRLMDVHNAINPETGKAFMSDDTFERAKKKLGEFKDDSKDKFDQIKGFLEGVGQKFEDTFINAFSGGKFEARQFFGEILQNLARLVIQLTIIQPILQSVTALFENLKGGVSQKKSTGGGILMTLGTSLVKGLFGGIGGSIAGSVGNAVPLPPTFSINGAFAEGGRPDPGKVSLVGEKGPELFIPDAAGTVMSNKDLRGLGGDPMHLTQKFEITTNDSKGFRELLMRERTYIQRMSIEGIQAAQNKRGRNGPLDKGRK